VLLHPRDADVDLVERAPIPRTLRIQLRILRRLARSRDPHVLADERTARHVTCRQYDLANRLALGADAQHLAIAVHGLPDVAFDVDGESVGFRASIELPENAWVAYSTSGCVEVVGVDGGLCGVYEVEGGIGEGPADAVWDDEFGTVRCAVEDGVEA
jgi:hypothetical protein